MPLLSCQSELVEDLVKLISLRQAQTDSNLQAFRTSAVVCVLTGNYLINKKTTAMTNKQWFVLHGGICKSDPGYVGT
jgi:hypothetical protein